MGTVVQLRAKVGPDVRLTKLVAVRRDCELTFFDLSVYSTLLYRSHNKPLSKRRLSLYTGLEQSKTIPKVLKRLSEFDLCKKSGTGWIAVEPPEQIISWFVMQDADQLRNKYRYNWVLIPSVDSPFTTLQSAIVAQLLLGNTHAAVSRFLRVSVKTISRVLKIISEKGLSRDWFQQKGLVVTRKKETVTELNFTSPIAASEANPKANPKPIVKHVAPLIEVLGVTEPGIAQSVEFAAKLTSKLLTPKQVRRFFVDWFAQYPDPHSEKLEMLLYGFSEKLTKVSTDHNYNKRLGKTHADNCYHLLRSEYKLPKIKKVSK